MIYILLLRLHCKFILISKFWLFPHVVTVPFFSQEFMFCVVPLLFRVCLDVSLLPLPFACLHSLLESFLGKYYYSSASSALDNLLNHCRQFRNSSVKLVPSTIVKKVIAVAKGSDYKYDTSEVCLFCCCYLFIYLFFVSPYIHVPPPPFVLPSSYLQLY